MNFIYSCIGDNTSENRVWLEELGYKPNSIFNVNDTILYTDEYELIYRSIPESVSSCLSEERINCIGNPALFRAVTAMKDDSDYMQ